MKHIFNENINIYIYIYIYINIYLTHCTFAPNVLSHFSGDTFFVIQPTNCDRDLYLSSNFTLITNEWYLGSSGLCPRFGGSHKIKLEGNIDDNYFSNDDYNNILTVLDDCIKFDDVAAWRNLDSLNAYQGLHSDLAWGGNDWRIANMLISLILWFLCFFFFCVLLSFYFEPILLKDCG